MAKPFELRGVVERPLVIRMPGEQVLFLALMIAIFGIRVVNLQYNSLFVDEAIYATVGRNLLAGMLDHSALTWMYGSYLYPTVMAGVDYITGEVGLRLVSAILSTTAAYFIYKTTLRLFDGGSAVWATLFFGLTAISINIGQYAVYDAPVVPALALCLYLLVRATEEPPAMERRLQLIAAVVFALGALSKYFAVLYLPMLLCVGAACALRQGRSLRPLAVNFLTLTLALLCGYAWINWRDLSILMASDYGIATGARSRIFADIWAEIGATSLIALAGLGLLARRGLPHLGAQPEANRRLWPFIIVALGLSLFAAPIYHLVMANQHAAWKHTVYSLIFLAPLAGYTCTSLVSRVRALPGRAGLIAGMIGAITSGALVIWGLDYALERNWGFQHSWPNTSGVVAHLQASQLVPGTPVLAEGAAIYEYYLHFGPEHRAMWTSTWYVVYEGLTGIEAMEAAIADHHYQVVILDSYYTPEFRERLETALNAAGYRLGFEETQQLSLGFPAQLAVYHAP